MPSDVRQAIIAKLREYSELYLHGNIEADFYAKHYRELHTGFVLDHLIDTASEEDFDDETPLDILYKIGRYIANDRRLDFGERVRIQEWFARINQDFHVQITSAQIEIPLGMPIHGGVSRRRAMILLSGAPLAPFLGASGGYLATEIIMPYFTSNRTIQGVATIAAGGAGLDLAAAGVHREAEKMRAMPPSLNTQELNVVLQRINGMIERMERGQNATK